MTLESSVLGEDAVRRTADGYEVDVHLAWYRSLPLSCVENVSVKVGGTESARETMRVIKDGRTLTLDELAALSDEEWFVQDPLTIRIPTDAPLEKGAETRVEVSLATRIPYIIIGPNMALVKRTDVKRKVVVQ